MSSKRSWVNNGIESKVYKKKCNDNQFFDENAIFIKSEIEDPTRATEAIDDPLNHIENHLNSMSGKELKTNNEFEIFHHANKFSEVILPDINTDSNDETSSLMFEGHAVFVKSEFTEVMTSDKDTQVCFLDKRTLPVNIFICNRYISDNCRFSDTEVQNEIYKPSRTPLLGNLRINPRYQV